MSTKFLSPGWRMPRNANQSKQSNYSMDFDGSSSVINLGNTDAVKLGAEDFTFSAWINPNSWGSGYEGIYSNNSTNGVFIGKDNAGNFVLRITSVSNVISYSTLPTVNTWTHICITRLNGTCTLYYNGSSVATGSSTQNFNANTNVYIGGDPGTGPSTSAIMNGQITEVSIFDYALSPSQVTTLWGGGTFVSNPMALPSPPIAYYLLGTSAWNGEYLAENNAIGDYVFDFDYSNNNYIDLNNAGSGIMDNQTSFSVSAWFKLNNNSITSAIMANWYGSTLNQYLLRMSGGQGIQWYTRVGSSVVLLNTNYQPNVGEWIHVVGVKDAVTNGGQMRVYINGAESTNSPLNNTVLSGALSANNTADTIGVFSNNVSFINGSMSNVAYWTSTALTQPEVTTLYNNGSPIRTLANIPQNSNLKAWYKLDASEVYNSSTTEWEVNNAQSAYQSSLNFSPRSSSNRVNLPSINLGTVNSISFWCRRLDNLSHKVLGSPTGSQNDPGIFAYLGTNVAYLSFGDGVNNYSKYFQANDPNYTLLRSDDWIHFLIVRNGNTSPNAMTLYINEQAITSFTTSPTLSNDTILNTIGAGGITGHQNSANCDISNLSIFNSALGSTDANSLYNSGSPLSDMSSFSSLVSWWKLDNTSAGVQDSKGSNNATSVQANLAIGSVSTLNGDSSGMTQANLVQSDLQTVAPYSKYAMDFDGVDDYIDCGDTDYLNGVTQMSVSVWFNADIALGGRQGLIGDMQSVNYNSVNGHFHIVAIDASGSDYSFRIYFIGTDSIQHSINIDNRPFTAGQWHNLVMTYNAGTVNFYVDGSLAPSTIHAGAPIPTSFVTLTNNKPLEIGRWSTVEWDGKISNPSIWGTALTSAQVTEIYNEGLPSNLNSHSAYSNLISWWQLGENSSYVGGATNPWTFADEKGTNNGTSGNLPEIALTNGVGTTANGVSTGMSEGSLVGDAPYSTANALSSGMSVVSRVTGVSDATITTGGTGYSTGTNIATTGGSGTNCTINITTVSGGAITAITINSGGNNYLIGDVLTVSGGNGNATITVSGLNTP